LPTSTGKTLISELCLAAALEGQPGADCYITPYVATGRQVASTLQRHLPPNHRVHTLVGGFKIEADLVPGSTREWVVATPERFDALLRSFPALRDNLRGVVVDEAHTIENGVRGARLEGILARLRLLQDRGRAFRTVL